VVAVAVAVMVADSLPVCDLVLVEDLMAVDPAVCVMLSVTVSVNVTIAVNVAIPASYAVAVAVLVNVAFPPSGLDCPQIPPVHTSGLLHRLLKQHGWFKVPQGTQLPAEQTVLARQLLLAQQG
jgi:hypothetical protein